ncbi:SRPBCC family protein [Prosthecochloris sp. HL-130-GSB]|jgi:ribosome-associated toxin RatA of RatAB toxin-antitoxin module|uniref:Cyclase n=1 Tax=Prosthecochloris aestuarii TaxID=1102 RepID=A0A831SRQ4_PROAE|nr:SRPBCC family protein [Prosthecochloris sp. HL-130-GSB]ARM31270.1 cyclase [Prosthecochloris sp. HL-130-GSB]MBO8092444.1 SRPBCC family protein [Prosthecochloris sp.]HED30828.1 cyclase [Prosthecochloris aestuarii]
MDEHKPHSLSNRERDLLDGHPRIELSYRENDIIHAEGAILINTPASVVWNLLADYNNLSSTIPKVIESRLVEDRGSYKVIDQTGRSGILFIEKSVHIVLRVKEEYPRQLCFDIIEGDFTVYKGFWTFKPGRSDNETFVSWQADVKPSFFAPPFLVSFVQHQDLPVVLRAIKKLAESRFTENRKIGN